VGYILTAGKMNKTVVAVVSTPYWHQGAEKHMYKRAKIFVHDERNELVAGDRVLLKPIRHLSKRKCHIVDKFIKRAGGMPIPDPSLQKAGLLDEQIEPTTTSTQSK